MTSAARRVPRWISALIIIVLVAAAVVGGILIGRTLGASEVRSTQVIRSVSLEQEIILLSAGVADIKESREDRDFFGLFDIPGTERELYVKYEFDAKFGIDGEKVSIEAAGPGAYRIAIPEFEYLGADEPQFAAATENNGLLSWSTPAIDKFEFMESTLTEEAVAEHLEGLRPLLEAQAATFYTNIVTSIEPEAEIEFEFSGARSEK